MSIPIIVLVALVASVGQSVTASAEENAVDITSKHGKHLEFPYFENFKEIDLKVKELVVPEVIKIIKFWADVTNATLANEGKRGVLSWARVGYALWNMGQDYAKKRKVLGKESGTSAQFNVKLQKMFKDILSDSSKIEKELKAIGEPKNFEQLSQRATATFESLNEAIAASPVAIYFDWTKGKIDGKEAKSELADFIGQLRYHGFNGAMNALESLMNFIFKASSKGWK